MRWWLAGLWMVLLIISTACTPKTQALAPDGLPARGDAAQGEALFAQLIDEAPSCISCHALDSTRGRGPGLAGYGAAAGMRVDGEDARTYTFYSIIDPGRHLVSGYSNVMYREYAVRLSPQQLADLIAFVLTL